MAEQEACDFEDLLDGMKRAAAALRDAGVPFMLAGGIASWARGGPPTEHDVDFMLKPDDIDRAAVTLEAAGFLIEQPPEEWLMKAFDGPVMIDLIHRPVHLTVDDRMLDRADEIEVQAVTMRVMAADDILATKLLALSEHNADFESVLEVGRALREQIDWEGVRRRTESSPFAKAYFLLADELGLALPAVTT
jgi:predicted nucleotidyltransferase